jgi:hypothetical protein
MRLKRRRKNTVAILGHKFSTVGRPRIFRQTIIVAIGCDAKAAAAKRIRQLVKETAELALAIVSASRN